MEQLVQTALGELESRKAVVEANIHQFATQDNLAAEFTRGEITVKDILKRIGDKPRPYELREQARGKYSIVGNTTPYMPMIMVDAKDAIKIWDNVDLLIKAYPNMKSVIEAERASIGRKGCSTCNKKTKAFSLINKLANEELKDRSHIRELEVLFGKPYMKAYLAGKFVNKVTGGDPPRKPAVKKVQTKTEEPKPEPKVAKHVGHGVRPTCINCCRKHIAQAMVLLEESRMGYPAHRWLAVGHLAEASSEMITDYPAFANKLRLIRIQVMNGDMPNMLDLFDEIEEIEEAI